MHSPVHKRRICWPNPDATCLEGGCVHCDGYPMRSVTQILSWAKRAGDVPNRCGGGTKSAVTAFQYGETAGWPNIETE